MPIYVYTCTSCGKESELLVATHRQRAGQTCPHCGRKTLKNNVAGFSVGAARGECGAACGLPGRLPSCRPDACGFCKK